MKCVFVFLFVIYFLFKPIAKVLQMMLLPVKLNNEATVSNKGLLDMILSVSLIILLLEMIQSDVNVM